nr:zinc finger protein [Hymenolepis microstoma]
MNNSVCLICEGKIKSIFAVPSTCDHVFHLSCLMQWTSQKTTDHNCPCPQLSCDKEFDSLNVLSTGANSLKVLATIHNLICPICIDVVKSPIVIMNCCERTICLNCLIPALKQKSQCPMDRSVLKEITALSWIKDSATLFRDYNPTVKYLKDISHALSSNFTCRLCKSAENVEDIYFCITCFTYCHRTCDPNPVFECHPFIWICTACIEQSRGEPR